MEHASSEQLLVSRPVLSRLHEQLLWRRSRRSRRRRGDAERERRREGEQGRQASIEALEGKQSKERCCGV